MIAPFIEIPMLNIKCITMHKLQLMHAGAMSKLLYGLCVCTSDIQLVKARGFSTCTYAQTLP